MVETACTCGEIALQHWGCNKNPPELATNDTVHTTLKNRSRTERVGKVYCVRSMAWNALNAQIAIGTGRLR